MCLSLLIDKRTQDYEKHKLEEIRFRRLAYYASSWLDHKGKTWNDLYPLPWEIEERQKIDKDMAAMAALELQKRLQGKALRKIKKDGIRSKSRL
jgi:hypothetical protein